MKLKDKTIGFAITGSFCTFSSIIPEIRQLKDEGANVIPIISHSVNTLDTRFNTVNGIKSELEEITGNHVIVSITGAEPIGPKELLDLIVVAPCTGNTIAKLANAITDTSVTMAVKAHLRNNRPVVLAISTNDALAGNAKNIGLLLNTKNMFFVPFYQDDPIKKSNSLLSKNELIVDTICEALNGKQIQPLLA